MMRRLRVSETNEGPGYAEVEVATLDAAIQALWPEGAVETKYHRDWGRFVFRGHDDASWHLEPRSVMAAGTCCPMTDFQRRERQALEMFLLHSQKLRGAESNPSSGNVWEDLAEARHFGLSVRLLDWSFSPYTALHFATADRRHADTDGCVWMVDLMCAAQANVFRNYGLARTGAGLDVSERRIDQPHSEVPPEHSCFTSVGCPVWSWEMLVRSHALGLDNIDKGGRGGAWEMRTGRMTYNFAFFRSRHQIERNLNQYSCFSVRGYPANRDKFEPLEKLLRGAIQRAHDERMGPAFNGRHLLKKVVIPPKAKECIRAELDRRGFNEFLFFPDRGGLASWINRSTSTPCAHEGG